MSSILTQYHRQYQTPWSICITLVYHQTKRNISHLFCWKDWSNLPQRLFRCFKRFRTLIHHWIKIYLCLIIHAQPRYSLVNDSFCNIFFFTYFEKFTVKHAIYFPLIFHERLRIDVIFLNVACSKAFLFACQASVLCNLFLEYTCSG